MLIEEIPLIHLFGLKFSACQRRHPKLLSHYWWWSRAKREFNLVTS